MTYSKYFSGCPRPCLSGAKATKDISIEGVSLWGISAGSIFIWYSYVSIDVKLFDISWLSLIDVLFLK